MAFTAIIFLFSFITTAHSLGAISVDLGSEWMKVGVVAPGVPMDIALSIEGERKVPMAVAMSDGNTFTGYQALKTASKYPEKVFTHFLDLVGKPYEHESVLHYKQHFPHANITSSQDANSTSIVLNHPDGLSVTPLELITIMLKHAHNQVKKNLGNSAEHVNEIVITIPPFFHWDERRVIRQAAKDAGLKVLKLIHTNSAFALSYGIFRHTDYATNSSVMFFDQGAKFSSITLADYYLSANDTLPTVEIKHEAYDRALGGLDMELKFRDYLAGAFCNKTGIDKNRVRSRSRSMYKLFQEAKRVKKVLSANSIHNARIENVIDDQDFLLPVSRLEYEDLCGDLLDSRVKKLLSQLSAQQVPDLLIIVGGNTRTPKIQQILKEYYPSIQIGKYVNADEGAALAALYQAASLVPGFKVKQYSLIEYPREIDPEELVPQVDDMLKNLLNPFENLNISMSDLFKVNSTIFDTHSLIPDIPLNATSDNITVSTDKPQTTTPEIMDQVTPQPPPDITPHDEL